MSMSKDNAFLSAEKKKLLMKVLHGKKIMKQNVQNTLISENKDAFPLSHSQEWLWFFEQIEPGSSYYNVVNSVRIYGEFKLVAMSRAVNTLLERHEILRTTFAMQEGQPVQIIHTYQETELEFDNIQELTPEQQEKNLYRVYEQEVFYHFNLQEGPLFRVKVIRCSPIDHVLIVNLHHLIHDGWSRGILTQELGILYLSFCSNQVAQLPPMRYQYRDYVLWQQQYLQGKVLEEQLAFWKQQLAGVQATMRLGEGDYVPVLPTMHGELLSFAVTAETRKRLIEMSEDHGLTLFMTLLSLFAVLIYINTKQEDFLIYTRIANRSRAEQERLIGCLFKMLPLRINMEGNPTLVELFQRIKAICLAAYDHQDTPLTHIRSLMQEEAKTSSVPRIQAVFVLHNFPALDFGESPVRIILPTFKIPGRISPFDLDITMKDAEGNLHGWIEYNTGILSKKGINDLLEQYSLLMKALPQQLDKRLSEIV